MKNALKFSLTLALTLVACFTIGTGAVVCSSIGVDIPTVVAASTGVELPSFVVDIYRPDASGYATAGISVEIWVKYIMDNLWKGNEFMAKSFNESDNVLSGAVVHIPQSGAKPTIRKNRSTFPATAVRRTDTTITYPLDDYTSDPAHIPKAELMEISYDKIGSVIGEHIEAINELIADDMLYNWRAEGAANIIRTSGTADAAFNPNATAVGTRKKFMKEELKKAKFLMNKANISKQDRVALLPSEFLEQLVEDEDLKKRDSSMELDMRGGVVTRLYGFDIMERSDVITYDNAGTPVAKAVDAVDATTDNMTALCWQKNAVAKAQGTIDFFEDLSNPLYYGDIYSALCKVGGRKRRGDNLGVIGIVQTGTYS